MPQMHSVSSNNTAVVRTNEGRDVYLHGTKVVSHNALENTVTLNSGGWTTATTKSRMNQYSNEFLTIGARNGYRVFQKNFDWFVQQPNGEIVDFYDGITIKLE